MNDRLRSLLPPEIADQLPARWERFRRRHPGAGATTFLAQLHADGAIDVASLKDALGALRIDSPAEDADVAPETLAGDRYEVVGVLGRGAMGEVSIALDRRLDRSVAVKRMDPDVAAQPELARRFYTEARITAQLDHPGIIPVYSYEVREDGTREYAMKLIRGRTLADVLDETRRALDAGQTLDEDHALPARLELFAQICNAVHYAHVRGVIHRDLKPENVMVGPFHEVIVMDWGIAKVIGAAEEQAAEVVGRRGAQTQVGFVIGTPVYMSPEQSLGRNDELDARSDQFTLGLILQELLTLAPPRAEEDLYELVATAQRGGRAPVRPYHRRAPVPSGLSAIVAKACAPHPEARYPDVEALADDVRRYLHDEELVAAPDGLLQRAQRLVSHHRTATLVAFFALLFAVFGVAVLGVAGAGIALEVSQRQAAARELRLAEHLRAVGDRSHRIDTRLRGYEALLEGLTFAATEALTRPPPSRRVYLAEDYRSGHGPPDLAPTTLYPRPMSVQSPDLVLAPGVERAAVEERLWQLDSLQPSLQRVLLASHDPGSLALDESSRAALLRGTRVPVVWSYVAIEEGVLVGYPGVGEYPEGYDPRSRSWYRDARGAPGVRWGTPDLDASGLGLLLTATRTVHAQDGTLLGVAAIDIELGHVVEDLLLPRGTASDVKAWLVDLEGRVVVDADLAARARTMTEWAPEPLPAPTVVGAIQVGAVRHLQADLDGKPCLFAWAELDATDLIYVLAAPVDAVFGD